MKKSLMFVVLLALGAGLTGCTPEVGSKAWCQMMDDKPKGDWTANQAADYARHCIFRDDDRQ